MQTIYQTLQFSSYYLAIVQIMQGWWALLQSQLCGYPFLYDEETSTKLQAQSYSILCLFLFSAHVYCYSVLVSVYGA
jgi:hypothetical protein